MHMDALFLSRLQFAWLIAFHILLPAFTVGLSCYVATLEIRYWLGKDDAIGRLSAFWIKIFAISFGMGVGLVVGYALLGATWLYMKTEGALQQWARSMARRALFGILAFILMVSLWTPLASERIAARWFTLPNFFYFLPVPVLTALLAWAIWNALRKGREVIPFLGTMGLFFLSFSGLIISLWPYVAPPSITLWDAASAPMSQQFLMVGTMFLLPVILLHVVWSYWVFRGKVRADLGYHDH
jgi:cytochrome d ubiquinol oxidase subunit II